MGIRDIESPAMRWAIVVLIVVGVIGFVIVAGILMLRKTETAPNTQALLIEAVQVIGRG